MIHDKFETFTCCSTGAPSSGSLLEHGNAQVKQADLGIDRPH